MLDEAAPGNWMKRKQRREKDKDNLRKKEKGERKEVESLKVVWRNIQVFASVDSGFLVDGSVNKLIFPSGYISISLYALACFGD